MEPDEIDDPVEKETPEVEGTPISTPEADEPTMDDVVVEATPEPDPVQAPEPVERVPFDEPAPPPELEVDVKIQAIHEGMNVVPDSGQVVTRERVVYQ